MRRLLLALRDRWRSLHTPAPRAIPYTVVCICGRSVQGARSARHQVVRCPGCGAGVFILPRSPLPAAPDEEPPAETPRPRRSPWLVPLAAAGVTLLLVGAGLLLFFSLL